MSLYNMMNFSKNTHSINKMYLLKDGREVVIENGMGNFTKLPVSEISHKPSKYDRVNILNLKVENSNKQYRIYLQQMTFVQPELLYALTHSNVHKIV